MNPKMPALMSVVLLLSASLTVSAAPPAQSTAAKQEARAQPLTATLEVVKPQKGDLAGKVGAATFPRVETLPVERGRDCAPDEATIDIEILTDDFPSETVWEVTEYCTGMVVCSGGPYDQPNTLYNERCCIGYNDCVDFTIYDSYGDGIYAPGGYSVAHEGELLYSCMGQGWCCTSETVEFIGDACVLPEGACCVQVDGVWDCLYTFVEPDCDEVGGRFYVYQSCPDFDCPQCEVDFCVEAPYSGPMRNTCNQGNDCALRASEDHEYEVHIPNDGTWTFSLCGSAFDTYLFVGTTLCGQEIGYNDDYCGLQSQLSAYVTAGLYYVTVEAYGSTQCGDYVLNVWEEVEPEGACCVGLDCVATNTYLECQALGGTWYEGQECPDFVCPVVPNNDLCENAEPVGPPYPVTVYGSNEAATIDCPGLLDWYSTWWAIELPYAENNLHIDFCETPFEITNVGIVIMDDCACDDYVTYSGVDWYACPSGLTSPTIWWNGIPGPSTWLFPVYFNEGALEPYTLTIDVEEVQPCVIECEEGDILEGEPECYDDYEDTYNGGCGSFPPVFQPIECGQTICATSGTFYYDDLPYRETDWFAIETTTPMNFTWTVEAEFEVLILILDGGSGNCVDYEIYGHAIGPACTPVSLSTTEGMMPGHYWFWVGPTEFGSGVPCGSTYRATLTCEPATGACCDDDTGDCEDDVLMDDCPPPLRFARDTLCADLSPPCGGCPEAMIRIEIMTDIYPEETTWEVTVFYTGEVVASGGPYDQADTLYTAGVCVPYDSCHDFTIFDSYGDGIYSPGGYSVYYEGELIYSCMGQGWCCTFETVEFIGDGCIPPTGACCMPPGGHEGCVATNTEDECDALGGRWYEGETCPEFWCPPPYQPDFWVEAPYEGPLRNTCGAGNDCALLPSEEHEYGVAIPNDGTWTFSLCGSEYDTYMYVGTTICGQEVGYNDDYCGLQSQLTADITAGLYYVTVEAYGSTECGDYVLNVWEEIPCEVECPPDGTIEGEPICYDDYVDTYNGGCNSLPFIFQPIQCGETICGTSGTFYFGGTSYRDTDWFEIELESATNVRWTVCAEFEVLILVIDAGSGNCFDATILGNLICEPYQQATLSYGVGPGLYWFWVGPAVFGSGVPCGSEYVGTLTVCPGDIDRDCDTDLTDLALLLSAYGSVPGDPNWNPACDFDADTDVGLTDLAFLLSDYGCGG